MPIVKVSRQPTPSVRIKTETTPKRDANLSQRAYLNAIAAAMDYAAQLVVALVVSPILVSGLGSTMYGVLQILQRLTSYLSAADGRPTQALKWTIAHQQASDDHTEKQRAIGSAIGVWLMFLPLLAITGAVVIWVSPTVTKVPQGAFPPVRASAAFLVMGLILISLVTLPESVLRGMNLGYKRMILTPVITIFRGVLTAGAIYLSFGLVGVAAAPLVASVLAGIMYWGTVRRYIPWFRIAKPTLAEIRRFASFSGWFLAWRLVNRILMSGDVVILGIIASAELVTVYTLTGYAAQVVVGVIGITMGAIVPGMGGLIGAKQHQKAAIVRSEMLVLNWLMTTVIGVGILLWNRSFITLWVGPIHYAGPWANLLIVLAVTQLAFIRTDAFIIDLTLNLSRKVALGGLSALLSLGIAAVLIKPFWTMEYGHR